MHGFSQRNQDAADKNKSIFQGFQMDEEYKKEK